MPLMKNFVTLNFKIFPIIFATIGLGILISYQVSMASGMMVLIEKHFPLEESHKTKLISSILIGGLLGIPLGGWLADRLGRKNSLCISSIFLLIGSYCSTLANCCSDLCLFRLILGFGIGIASIIIPVYLTEVCLVYNRGKIASLFPLSLSLGMLFSYTINYYVSSSSQNWHVPLNIGFSLAIFAVILLFFIPESPRWLLITKKPERAKKILLQLYPNSVSEIEQIVEEPPSPKVTIQELFEKGLREAWILCLLLVICIHFSGISVFLYYGPEIWILMGIEDASTRLLITFTTGFLNFLTPIFALCLIDKWGRKKLLQISALGMLNSMLLGALLFHMKFLSLFFILSFVAFFGFGLGPVSWVVISENFPTNIRGKASSQIIFVKWFIDYLVAIFFFPTIKFLGAPLLFLLFACFSLFSFYISSLFPETGKKRLEEIQKHWKN